MSLYGQSAEAEFVLSREDDHASVGLSRQEDGTFAMVGDFYHARVGPSAQKLREFYCKDELFKEKLQTAYCIEQAKAKVEEAGFFIEDNLEGVVGKDGMITMVACGYE